MTLPQQGVEKLSPRGKPLGVIGMQRGRSKWPLRLTTLTGTAENDESGLRLHPAGLECRP